MGLIVRVLGCVVLVAIGVAMIAAGEASGWFVAIFFAVAALGNLYVPHRIRR